jgi:hypothetical protein
MAFTKSEIAPLVGGGTSRVPMSTDAKGPRRRTGPQVRRNSKCRCYSYFVFACCAHSFVWKLFDINNNNHLTVSMKILGVELM